MIAVGHALELILSNNKKILLTKIASFISLFTDWRTKGNLVNNNNNNNNNNSKNNKTFIDIIIIIILYLTT